MSEERTEERVDVPAGAPLTERMQAWYDTECQRLEQRIADLEYSETQLQQRVAELEQDAARWHVIIWQVANLLDRLGDGADIGRSWLREVVREYAASLRAIDAARAQATTEEPE